MLREPRPVEKKVEARKDNKSRFRLVRLEQRIAPTSHTNPQGPQVGGWGKNGGFHGRWA